MSDKKDIICGWILPDMAYDGKFVLVCWTIDKEGDAKKLLVFDNLQEQAVSTANPLV